MCDVAQGEIVKEKRRNKGKMAHATEFISLPNGTGSMLNIH